MNKLTKFTLWGSGILIVLIFSLQLFGIISLFPQSALSKTFTPVYCNDPTSVCCVKTSDSSSISLSGTNFFVCPSYAINCVITNVQGSSAFSGSSNIFVGSQNCRVKQDITTLFIKQYTCDDASFKGFLDGSVNVDVPKGYSIYADRATTLSINVVGQKLVTNLGVNVLSNSCTYNVSSGEKVTNKNGIDLGISYTVPAGSAVGSLDSCVLSWTAGKRHICGNLEEQCSADSDCIGHTFGTKECTDRTLQTYGCNKLPLPNNVLSTNGVFVQKDSVSGYSDISAVTARCEIKSAVTVQCCGDSDCGSSGVCDVNTFTCKAPSKVECSVNSDCGVSTQCDFSVKALKTPICTSSGNCDYTTKNVGCCVDSNCPVDQFCNANNKCEVKGVITTACPFTCCDRDTGYVDRACSDGLSCVAHSCQITPECSVDSDCNNNFKCDNNKCVAVSALSCSNSAFGLITRDVGVKEDCGFLCSIGLKSPENINVCVTDYTPLILVIITVLAIFGLILFSRKGKSPKKPSATPNFLSGDSNILFNKNFWIIIGVLLAVGLIIGYFKYVFWSFVGLFILALIYIIVRMFLFKK